MELINHISRSKYTAPVAAGLIGVAGGFAAGYFIGRRNASVELLIEFDTEDGYTEDVEEDLTEDINEEEEERSEPSPEFVNYQTIITESRYDGALEEEAFKHTESDEPEPEKVVERSIFPVLSKASTIKEWDYDEEDKVRAENPTGPYTIHIDEYARNDLGFHQESLTYYAGDDILADEANKPIYNYKKMTGELQFGYGSNSPGLVYIRNGGIRYEWEIFFNPGSFSEEVLGLDVEAEYEEQDLKHANVPKFRLKE